MTFWESQSTRNEKRTREARDYFFSRARKLCDDPMRRLVHQAWFTGATFLARTMLDRTILKGLWGKGELRKCVGLSMLCASPMITIWFRNGRNFPGQNVTSLESCKLDAVTEALKIAGSYNEFTRDFFLNMDTQYNHELDLFEAEQGQGVGGLYYSVLLLAAVRNVWEAPLVIDWWRQAFPVKSRNDYALVENAPLGELMGCAEGQDMDDFVLMPAAIVLAGTTMFGAYRALLENRRRA